MNACALYGSNPVLPPLRRLRLCAAFTGLVILAVAVSAVGQTATPAQGDAAIPANASSDLGEIVVTAQRREERLVDVPITVTTVTGDTLDADRITNMADLVQVVPGLTYQAQGNFYWPNIRGVSGQTASASSDGPIAVYVDGIYQQGETGNFFDLPDVDHIEVDKGPQGTLFGRNSTGGAIQVFTKGPSFTPTADFSVGGGLYTGAGPSRASDDLSTSAFVTGPLINNILAGSFSVSERHVDGYSSNYDYGRVSPLVSSLVGNAPMDILNSFSARAKLLFTPIDGLRITAEGFYLRSADNGYAVEPYTGLTAAKNYPDGLYSSQPWNYAFTSPYPGITRWNFGGSFGIAYDFAAGTLRSFTAFNGSKYFLNSELDGAYSPDCYSAFVCAGSSNTLGALNQALSEEVLFTSAKSGWLNYTVGGNVYSGHINEYINLADFTNGALPAAPQIVHPPLALLGENIYTRSYAAFVDADFTVTDHWVISAGVRYSEEKKSGYDQFAPYAPGDFFPDLTEVVFTPRGSIRYVVDPSTNVYATISRGFTSGIYTSLNPGAPPTKPEEITAYEVGMKSAKPTYAWNAAVFFYDYSEMQVTSLIEPLVSVTNNAAVAHMGGLDLDGTYNVTDSLRAQLGIAWLPLAKFEEYPQATAIGLPFTAGTTLTSYTINAGGSPLPRTPKLTFSFSPSYTQSIGSGQLTVLPHVYFSSTYYYQAIHNVEQGEYVLLGFDLTYKPNHSGLEYSLWGKNLTNRAVITESVITATAATVRYADPQEVGFTVKYHFGGI